jgi:tagatose 1,6-diphosphate aldolase
MENIFNNLTDGEIDLRLSLQVPSANNVNMPSYYFGIFLHNTDERIGVAGIRIGQNDNLYYLGNIEYEILPEYRGNHYAEKASRLLNKIAISYNQDRITITCNPNNIASRKTIESLGITLKEIAKLPKKHKLYRKGERQVCIYEGSPFEIEEKTMNIK